VQKPVKTPLNGLNNNRWFLIRWHWTRQPLSGVPQIDAGCDLNPADLMKDYEKRYSQKIP
jgi:hypothetical protein